MQSGEWKQPLIEKNRHVFIQFIHQNKINDTLATVIFKKS